MSLAFRPGFAAPYPLSSETISDADQRHAQDTILDNVDSCGDPQDIETREIQDGNGFHRIRHVATMMVGASMYALRITEAAVEFQNETSGMIAMQPGFTEDPSQGTARNLHDDTATAYPDKKIVSISSDGYNKDGTPLTWREINKSFNAMAAARLCLIRGLSEGEKTMFMGLSMGSVVTNIMVQRNLDRSQVNHTMSIYHSPALVPPQRIPKDMVLRFPPHIYADVVREVVHHPIAALKALHMPRIDVNILPAYICDLYNLLHGTPEREIEAVAAATKLGIIAGDLDPLAQLPMWQRLQSQYPENLSLVVKKGHGHGVSINSKEAAHDIRALATSLQAK